MTCLGQHPHFFYINACSIEWNTGEIPFKIDTIHVYIQRSIKSKLKSRYQRICAAKGTLIKCARCIVFVRNHADVECTFSVAPYPAFKRIMIAEDSRIVNYVLISLPFLLYWLQLVGPSVCLCVLLCIHLWMESFPLRIFHNTRRVHFIFTPQPSELEGYCRHGPDGRAGGCQTYRTHICVIAWRIFSVRSSVELSRHIVVHCNGHTPIYLPMGQNLVSNWVQTL